MLAAGRALRQLWRCPCSMPLGVVGPDGELSYYFPGTVDRWGNTYVRCPACGEGRTWRPERRDRQTD